VVMLFSAKGANSQKLDLQKRSSSGGPSFFSTHVTLTLMSCESKVYPTVNRLRMSL